MQIQTDRALVPAGNGSTRFLLVKVTAPDTRRHTERPAANVALVLDRSGSMSGSKMTNARKAVEHAIRLLDARDRLSLVVYDTEVDVLLESISATAEAKATAARRLAGIDARGGTDLAAGWLAGLEQVSRLRAAAGATDAPNDTISKVLLLSDGLANEGITDHDALARRAAEFRAKGVATSTFGVGADFDEVLMTRLATQGGGHFYFIETARQIPDLLASELGETLEIIARDATLDVKIDTKELSAGCLNDIPCDFEGNVIQIRLGDLVAGQEITLVLSLKVPPLPAGATAAIECRTVDRDHALYQGALRVEWRAVPAPEDARQPVNDNVLLSAATMIAERSRAKALDFNREGKFQDAKEFLRKTALALRELAPHLEGVERLARELEQESEDFAAAMAPADVKQRHFASYAASVSRSLDGKARRR